MGGGPLSPGCVPASEKVFPSGELPSVGEPSLAPASLDAPPALLPQAPLATPREKTITTVGETLMTRLSIPNVAW
jgi:hypothetical protein